MVDIFKYFLLFHPVIGATLVNFLGGNMNKSSEKWYYHLKKSKLTPPGYVFPIVWTALYILLGLNIMTIYDKIRKLNRPAFYENVFLKDYLLFFEIQLLLNFSWGFAFFSFKNIIASLVISVLMLLLTKYLLYKSWIIDKTSFYYLLPYGIWILFATYLNLQILLQN